MSQVNLSNQLLRVAEKVQQEVDAVVDGYPLKGWFQTELNMLVAGASGESPMEDLSARMRAIRQL